MGINLREGEIVVGRDGQKLVVGPIVLIDKEKDLASVRVSSTETRNFHPREIQSVSFLLDYFQNHRGYNSNRNERKLKGIIKSLIMGNNISESLREEILKELKEVPEVRGQEILEILLKK